MTLFIMFWQNSSAARKSLVSKAYILKNPIRPTLANVLQIGKIRLFVLLLMFYRFEWPSFALYQNVLQIRVARHCPLSKCSTDSTALTPIFPPLVKCSTDWDALTETDTSGHDFAENLIFCSPNSYMAASIDS